MQQPLTEMDKRAESNQETQCMLLQVIRLPISQHICDFQVLIVCIWFALL